MRGEYALLALAALPLLGAASPDRAARNAAAAASAADARAARLERQADAATDDATRARLREAAVTARIRAAEAAITASEGRIAATDRVLAEQRARLAGQQAPVTRLVAAVQSLARRPAAIAIVQPGSTADIIHARALLGTLMPVVRARTAAIRRDLDRTAALREDADAAAAALRDARTRLRDGQYALASLEGERRLGAGSGRGRALYESERAIALGEQARDLAGLMETTAAAADVRSSLAALPGPLPRPGSGAPAVRFTVPPYRLPAVGRIVEGLGELSDTGVRARGLSIQTTPAARVVAPAAGTIMFARRFRDYGTVVIVDHGGGWSTALTGLDGVDVSPGEIVSAGQPVGRAAMSERARIGVELRRRGTAMDIAQLLG